MEAFAMWGEQIEDGETCLSPGSRFVVCCCVRLHVQGQLAKESRCLFVSSIAGFLEVVICWWQVM